MTPLIRVTLAFMAGMVPGLIAPALLAAVVLGAVAAGALLVGRLRGTAVLVLFAALGAAAGSLGARAAETACPARWQHGQSLALRGMLVAEPPARGAVTFQPVGRCSDAIRVVLPRGRVVPAAVPLELRGRWSALPPETRWPVPPMRRGTLQVRGVRALRPGELRVGTLVRMRVSAQRSLRAALPAQHGVAEALVLAQRDALDPSLRAVFVNSGMAHLLAISGSHVVVFAGALLLLLRLLRTPVRVGNALAVVLISLYVIALGAVPPAARAAVQFALVMGAALLQRPAHAWTLIAAAALPLLALEPLNALDAGFQLSFAGVCGLLAYRRRIMDRLPARVPRFLRDELGTGLAATLATAPIAALHFGQFACIGLVASVLATPILALALPGMALIIALHPLFPAVALWLGPGIELLLALLLAIARRAAAVPGGHSPVSAGTLSAVLVIGAAALLWHARRRDLADSAQPPATPARQARARRLARWRAVQLAALAAAVLAWVPRFAPADDALEVHVIDVGQGDAIAIRTPRNRWVLIDAGNRSERTDMGQRRVVPYLLRQGVRRIDLLVLTHPHADHIGGAVAVLRALDVGTIMDPGEDDPNLQLAETLEAAADRQVRWIAPPVRGEFQLDGVHLRLLHPTSPLLDAPEDPNDISLVLQLAYGHFRGLFMGDAPAGIEAALLRADSTGLRATVLKVGHHGSRTSSSAEFLAAVAPRVAFVSVGRDNRYGHPDTGVMARLVRDRVNVLRTDERGTIRLRAWRSGRIALATQR